MRLKGLPEAVEAERAADGLQWRARLMVYRSAASLGTVLDVHDAVVGLVEPAEVRSRRPSGARSHRRPGWRHVTPTAAKRVFLFPERAHGCAPVVGSRSTSSP